MCLPNSVFRHFIVLANATADLLGDASFDLRLFIAESLALFYHSAMNKCEKETAKRLVLAVIRAWPVGPELKIALAELDKWRASRKTKK